MWFLRRVAGSQYPLTNLYDGEFVKGKRQGYGCFSYANGARFEGEWFDDMKQGKVSQFVLCLLKYFVKFKLVCSVKIIVK